MRFSHHEGRDASIAKIKPIADKYDIEIEIIDPGFTSGIASYEGEAFKLIEAGVKEVFPNVDKTVPYVVTGASDARFYDRVCDQCMRFLPFQIDDEQLAGMHGLNESIDVDSLTYAVDFYKYMMKNI